MADNLHGQEARQGKRGKPVLYVLIASLVLLGIALAGLMTWQGASSPKDYASQSTDAARKEVTGSVNGSSNATSSSNTSGTPAANPAYPAPAQPAANGNKQ
ncbi:hypothetical protein [Methylobacterium sp.]|jgi:flagellar basal body-associated protein FliL|uniref:hypothetical protein n=1 Tax=Methylobacterium sp. TaxID=409 RepID=UPI0026305D98|nr:hypothetical protein [Methylobacterium sp.]MDB5646933.1 hypothetical protein [Methylobacterium sp.]